MRPRWQDDKRTTDAEANAGQQGREADKVGRTGGGHAKDEGDEQCGVPAQATANDVLCKAGRETWSVAV